MVAPIIPQLNDRDLEAILAAAAANGATSAGWVLVRLPREVAPLFREWLDAHYPLRAAHIMSLIGQMRGGRDYDSTFGSANARHRRIRGAPRKALHDRIAQAGARSRPRANGTRHVAIPPAGAVARRRPPGGSVRVTNRETSRELW